MGASAGKVVLEERSDHKGARPSAPKTPLFVRAAESGDAKAVRKR